MTRRGFFVLFLLATGGGAGEGVVHHDLKVRLDPKSHTIEVDDATSLQRFRLHGELQVIATSRGFVEGGAVPLREYDRPPGARPESAIRYKGTIHHPLEAQAEEYARSFSETPGTISEEGVFLGGASGWYPVAADELVTFTLEVDVPKDWDVVSQGVRTKHEIVGVRRIVTWECKDPMEEIYLVAAPFTEYARGSAFAFLRTPDPALAGKYLDVTGQYLDMYGKLLGPYPFKKFALVENFWETGYGMPSFTLLGPQVIRFPFILHSSYPHEILHNWWGNGVYVDRAKGNWCEGLTAYLADHLIREGQGAGEEYRRDALKKYRAYVRGGKDFPLREFRERHSAATEAVGYGKALMVFHMLRMRIGDAKFTEGLQAFYKDFRFKRASWDDLTATFSEVAQEDLRPFFRQWVDRPGAPALAARLEWDGIVLEQTQPGDPYDLRVPVAMTVEGAPPRLMHVDMKGKTARLPLALRADIDPNFDLFRLLDRREIPPTLGELFGAEKVLIVLPEEPGGWQALADAWRVEAVRETDIKALPKDKAVWILGARNRWAKEIRGFVAEQGASVEADLVTLGGARHEGKGLSFVLSAPNPHDIDLTIGWIATDVPEAIPGLARKLPHYGKYSWLAFTGAEPSNVAKGQWRALLSPLVIHPERPRDPLPPREPLAKLAPAFDAERLMAHVRFLADEKLKGRGTGTPELDEAADYIARAFKEAGLLASDDRWEEEGGPGGRKVTLRNVVGVIPGTNPDWKDQCVVVGAHYDHLGLGWPDVRAGYEGQVHNGADDNASGVAVLLELARALAGSKPPRTIVLVAFGGEEWGLRGSRRYVKTTERKPFAMVNMDCVGRLGAQKLTLLGTGTAEEWKHIAMGVGHVTGVEAVCIPQDPGGSDQVAFHEAGIPAIQLFTGAHEDYHRPTDDVEKVDYDGMVRIGTFLRETIGYLSERDRALTTAGAAPAPAARDGREVGLGTTPDYAYDGSGVRVGSVREGSPAARAGVQAGDVLVAMDATELKALRDLSDALKSRAVGDVVRLRLRRGDTEIVLEVTLTAR